MSEQLKGSGEQLTESIDTSAEAQKNLEKLQERAEQAENDSLNNQIESLSKSAEQQSISGKELNVVDKGTEQSAQTFGNTKELKADTYKRTLRKVRTNLNVPDRALSRIVHQKTIESVSNVASKTVARPSALLGGSIGAFLGSAVLLYISRQSGFTYNYALVFFLFMGGFFAGACIELLFKLVLRKRQS